MKKMYNKPQVESQPIVADTHVMLLESSTGPSPAPKAHETAPSVPGESL